MRSRRARSRNCAAAGTSFGQCQGAIARTNGHYEKLRAGYLFREIRDRVREHVERNPDAKVIRLGIGDIVLPLPPPIVEALKAAADDLARKETFRGYGPAQGYDFLVDAIVAHHAAQGAAIAADEVFVSDGARCDSANIQEIFAGDSPGRGHRSGLRRPRIHQRERRLPELEHVMGAAPIGGPVPPPARPWPRAWQRGA